MVNAIYESKFFKSGGKKMNYKVNILTKCENEEETAVVVVAVLSVIKDNRCFDRQYNLVVKNLKRLPIRSPVWNQISRYEQFQSRL